jgi:nucleotide sugar dehydrogenase
VVGVEIDRSRLLELRTGRAPFYEPGLDVLLREQLSLGTLSFTDDFSTALHDASVVFLCVGTPPGPDGHPDTTAIAEAAGLIAQAMRPHTAVVTKSTVSVGSGAWLRTVIERAMGFDPRPFSVVSNPEFLREGSSISDFLFPERVVLGSDDPAAIDQVAAVYRPILEQSFAGADPDGRPELVTTDLATAETIKYAANAFLAAKISFINEIATICTPVGANVTDVARGIGLDSRIGPAFLDAGIGWGGSCFGKDLTGLSALAGEHGLKPMILQAVMDVNDNQRLMVVERLQQHLGSVEGKRIALLGLAFKPGTDDLRDSPAVGVAELLIGAGAHVTAHDPIVGSVAHLPQLGTFADAYDAVTGADALVIATDWEEFLDLDLERLRHSMSGRVFFDGRNLFDPSVVIGAGFIYEGIGRGHRTAAPQ